MVASGKINAGTGKSVLGEMFRTGQPPEIIVAGQGLRQISDAGQISVLVRRVLDENSSQVEAYLGGKQGVARWLFGQVMRLAEGQANPQVVRQELDRQLEQAKQARTV
jgi:aspartyl-tRNA(Asn)/glutamyl-tRNA(Gln) amidotransferase subunit B